MAFLSITGMLFLFQPGYAQKTAPTPEEQLAWVTTLPKRTLLVVYPTFTVKHQRIHASVANLDSTAKGHIRAKKVIHRDLVYRDSLLLALGQSFKEHYSFSPVFLLPDTSYFQWKKGGEGLTIVDLEGQVVAYRLWRKDEILILHKVKSSRDTETGLEQWVVFSSEETGFPKKFPSQFREGSLGTRFIRFLEAFVSMSSHPDTVEEIRAVTDYLAKQINKKWTNYYTGFAD